MTSYELKVIYASAPRDRRYLHTLELSHPLFPRTYYMVRDQQEWEFLLEEGASTSTTFEAVPFNVKMPTTDGKGQQDLELVLDNTGREAMDAIEAAAADPTINISLIYRVYIDLPDSAPQSTPYVLALQSITITGEAIIATATRADTLNRPFPTELYRVDLYPGLNR